MAVFVGCIGAAPFAGDTSEPPVDVSGSDAQITDDGQTDVLTSDATETDATETDATETDATETDATETDATETDATETDALADAGDVQPSDAPEPCTGGDCPCESDDDCDDGLACFEGSCCEADCEDKTCGGDSCGGSCGACAEGTYCNGFQACVDHLCTPDALYCGSPEMETEMFLYTCNDEGSGKLEEHVNCQDGEAPDWECIECAAEDTECWQDHNGAYCGCTPKCDDKACGDDGCGGVCGACGDEEFCDESQKCQPHYCTPNEPFCDGDWVHTCNAEGSEESEGGSFHCILKGNQETCVDGDDELGPGCQCVAACEGKACGPDGCGGLCGECADDAFCDALGSKFGQPGACHVMECIPSTPTCWDGEVTGVYICDSDGFVDSSQNPTKDCSDEGGGVCTISTEASGEVMDVCHCGTAGQFLCFDEGNGPEVGLCQEDGTWADKSCETSPDLPNCYEGTCVMMCSQGGAQCLGEPCSDGEAGEKKCAGGGQGVDEEEGLLLVCTEVDGKWVWTYDTCGPDSFCDWDTNECKPQGGPLCGDESCGDAQLCYGNFGQGGASGDQCHDCADVCAYICGDIYGNMNIGHCSCYPGDDGWPCEDGQVCSAQNQCVNDEDGQICDVDDTGICEGTGCDEFGVGAMVCATGPGANGSTYLECSEVAAQTYEWDTQWCPDGQVCDSSNHTCVDDDVSGGICGPGGSPCANAPCVEPDDVICLNGGKILYCQHQGGSLYEWNVLNGCPGDGEACVDDACVTACGACMDVEPNSKVCLEQTCVSCVEVCSNPAVCGLISSDPDMGNGSCECGVECDGGQVCSLPETTCVDPAQCELDCGGNQCATGEDACGGMGFCGAQCGFGQCGDDRASAVVVADNGNIYLAGHSCHPGSVDGCWLIVGELGPGGVMSGSTSIDDYSDWFMGFDDTRATAATLNNGDLYVVGWTRQSADNDKKRYGFIARFGVGNGDPVLKQLHRETDETVFLDIAMHPDHGDKQWLAGDAIVVGYSEPFGADYPGSRDPWAMRYQFPDPNTVQEASSWSGAADFGPYAATGEGEALSGEDMATGVSLISNTMILITGWTQVDPQVNGNSISPFVVGMNHLNGNWTSGQTLSAVAGGGGTQDAKVFGLKMQEKEDSKPYKAFLTGQITAMDQEHPWVMEISFTFTAGVFTFNAPNAYPKEKLFYMSGGQGALFDACLHPNGDHWVLVGKAAPGGQTENVVPYITTISNTSEAGGLQSLTDTHFTPTALSDFASTTDDAFRACAPTTGAGKARVALVGDIQEKGSEDGAQDDILMVDYYPGLDGPQTMELPCAGMPTQP